MSSPQPSSIPWTGHRLFTITSDDHRGQIWTVSIIFGVFSFLMLGLRVFIGHGNLGPDDWTAAAATLLGLVQLGSILAAASNGLGTNNGATLGAKVGNLTMTSEAILILGLALARCSVLLLIRRIESTTSVFCNTLLGLSLLWGLASVLAITINCSPSHIIGVDGFCEHQLLRWELITAVDSIIEIGIFTLVWALVRPLQMKLRKKALIALAFSIRVPVIVLAILHVTYVHRFLSSPNPTVAVASTVIIQQVELSYSLISCSLARLNTFLHKFGTGMGLGLAPEIYPSGTHRGGHELSYLRKGSKIASGDTELLRPIAGSGRYTSSISHPKSKTPSLEEELQRTGIRRDVHFRVSYEDVRESTYQADINR